MKNYLVKAEFFWDTSHIETFGVRCNTARKAEILAKKQIWAKYPNVGLKINILSIEEQRS